jgi:hypothetical protein
MALHYGGEMGTSDEAKAELLKMFSGPPTPPGKDRWHHREYELVRLDDGTIAFVRNALDAELKQIIDEAIEDLFPEPTA